MGTVFRRPGTKFFWIKFVDREGKEQRRSSETESRAEARALLEEIERQEKNKTPRAAVGALTVQHFYDFTWLPNRRLLCPHTWMADNSSMTNHFLPRFGERPIDYFATDKGEVDLLDWVIGLRASRS